MERTVIVFVSLFSLLCGYAAYAGDFIQLDTAKVDYRRFMGESTTFNFPSYQKDRLGLTLDSNIATYGFWRNRVHGTTDQFGFRWIGYNFDFGIRVAPFLDVLYEHHSQHLLDDADPASRHFPLEDSVGVSIYLFSKEPRKSLFQ